MKISIVIVSYAHNRDLYRVTTKALQTLRATEGTHQFEIIVVESQPGVKYHLADKMVMPKGKLNYNSYCNQGAFWARCRLIGFFNNDVIFFKGWAEAVVNALNANPDLGSVSPWCSRSHPSLGKQHKSGVHFGYRVRTFFAGWAFLMRRETLDKIGGFDTGVDFHYSDDLVIAQLKRHEIPHALVSGARVDHLESRTLHTLGDERRKKLTHGQKPAYQERIQTEYDDLQIPKKKWE